MKTRYLLLLLIAGSLACAQRIVVYNPADITDSSQPHIVDIRGHNWTLRFEMGIQQFCPDKAPCVGVADYEHRMIWIRQGQTTWDERDTVLHELLHAEIYETTHHDGDRQDLKRSEHDDINRYSGLLVDIFRRNANIIDYMGGGTWLDLESQGQKP